MPRLQLVSLLGLCALISLTMVLLQIRSSTKSIDVSPLVVMKTLAPSTPSSHPIHRLVTKAEKDFEEVKTRQSTSLAEAVVEYRRRYKLSPPPYFDVWYKFARVRGVELIDEYDAIYHSLLPFWGLKPLLIRGRAREALGFDNGLLGLIIRNGAIADVTGGSEWRRKSTTGMLKEFVQFLPDMDLPFNIYDEPRVIIPNDDLGKLVSAATNIALPQAFRNPISKNAWSSQPADLKWPNSVKTTRFNSLDRQSTWTTTRMSCSPSSPARVLNESGQDAESLFVFAQLDFISNKTAFSDVCLSPSLRERHGFFDRPATFNVVHDLFPIFSHSKISSYQDILYPSPWYWSEKVSYNENSDYSWEQKKNQLYWRGSTTGAYSKDGGWRRHHRQSFVSQINAVDTTKIMKTVNASAAEAEWVVEEAPRTNYNNLIDVKFTRINQCEPRDCKAQHQFFKVVKPDKQEQAWRYKYLLDIDGNAFSGRFYAFLKSMSLVYKIAVFREWHEDWLIPWVHYIPLSLKGDEHIETIRYFNNEPNGQIQAYKLAKQGRDWAGKVLRDEDFEVWLFRLLIEYGRLVDDDRETISYSDA